MENDFNIINYGFRHSHLYKNLNNIARVVKEDKNNYTLMAHNKGFIKARHKGALYKEENIETKACVGDFVTYTQENCGSYTICKIIHRSNIVTRLKARKAQAIASNVDVAFILMSLDEQFSIPRLERFLILMQEQNIKSVIVLNKKDLVDDYKPYVKQIRDVYKDIEIYPTSIYSKSSLAPLKTYLSNNNTVLMIGISGVGKSSLINMFAKEELQEVQEVSSLTGKGKHTTVARSIVKTKENFLFIDIPGIKEVSSSSQEDDVEKLNNEVVSKIQELAKACKFRNCSHSKEPSCAVLNAIKNGEIEQSLLTHYNNIKDIFKPS